MCSSCLLRKRFNLPHVSNNSISTANRGHGLATLRAVYFVLDGCYDDHHCEHCADPMQMQDNATMSNPANAGRLSTTTTSKPNDRQLRPRRKPVTYAYALEDTDFDGLEHHMAAWSQYAQPQNAQPQPQYAQPAAAISQTSALPHIRQPDSRESNLWPAPIFFAPFSDSPTEVEMRLV